MTKKSNINNGKWPDSTKVKTIEDVLGLVELTINQVKNEQMTAQKARCIGYLVRIVLKALETGELNEKIEAINGLILGRKINAKR